MGWLMDPIYNAISWILLQWHWVWDKVLPDGTFLGTTWDWVLAIVFLVITVRIILFPIFVKQIRSQRAMQALAPRVKELQAKHKGDQQTLREEMMKLYQTEKVNPLMGCLPLLLQIPVFFGLFRVLSHLNPSNPNKTQYGWSVEQFDSAVVARLFNAPIPARFADSASQLALLDADSVTVKVVAGVLVLIMMLTTFMTSRQMILKTGWSQEPQQRMIQKLMLYGIPISLLLSGWYFPIGVIIYWVVQNIFSLGQQYWVLHKYPPPVTENNIPPKTASARAREAAIKEPGFLARFFKVLPPAPKPAAGFVGTAQDQTRSGLFRRRSTAATPPPPEPRSLAPRPGAKPTKATPPAPAGSGTSDSTGTTPASGGKAAASGPEAKATPAKPPAAKPTAAKPAGSAKPTAAKTPPSKSAPTKAAPTKAAPTKAAPTKAAPTKAAPSGSSGSSANGSAPSGTTPTGGSSTASPNGAGGTTASGGSTGAGRPRSTTKKSPPRKGQANRKGGAKR
jgi:YidC/Oxa1 family membrane protein insertase